MGSKFSGCSLLHDTHVGGIAPSKNIYFGPVVLVSLFLSPPLRGDVVTLNAVLRTTWKAANITRPAGWGESTLAGPTEGPAASAPVSGLLPPETLFPPSPNPHGSQLDGRGLSTAGFASTHLSLQTQNAGSLIY